MSYKPHDCFMIDLTQFSSEDQLAKFIIDMKLDFNPDEFNAPNLWLGKLGHFSVGPMTKIWFNRKNLVWFAYQDNEGQKFSVEYLSFLSNMEPISSTDISPMDIVEDDLFGEVSNLNIDSILDKISRFGVSSLTQKEKEFLAKGPK